MLRRILTAAAIFAATTSSAYSNEIEDTLREIVATQLAPWLENSDVLSAIRTQNVKHSALTQSDIDGLDQKWRAEVNAAAKPFIDEVLARTASQYLSEMRSGTGGMVTEVFIMDNRGLNVAQSDPTSDYWQGDEDKFQKTFGMGSGSIHIGEIELDESSGSYQVQVSLSIDDPASGQTIGAATFGITME